MPLNIKNATVERLATSAARRLGVSKTEAVRRALELQWERLSEPSAAERSQHLTAFLEGEVWSAIPPELLGTGLSKAERERILGYNEDGV